MFLVCCQKTALSLGELFHLLNIKSCALFLINCFHHFAEGTSSQNKPLCSKGNPYKFRKSAAYVKGLHFGIKARYLKIILHHPQGCYIFWRKSPRLSTHSSRNTTFFLMKGPLYMQKNNLEIWNDVSMSEGILHPLQGHILDNYKESLQWIDGIQIFGEFEISVRAQAQRKNKGGENTQLPSRTVFVLKIAMGYYYLSRGLVYLWWGWVSRCGHNTYLEVS